jgi:hypothetical protein
LTGIDQVWRAAVDGKCQTLLVEKDFKYPANLSPAGDRLLPYTGKGTATLDDAVDEAIERVLDFGWRRFPLRLRHPDRSPEDRGSAAALNGWEIEKKDRVTMLRTASIRKGDYRRRDAAVNSGGLPS